jgi:hypothetical protein
MGRWIKRAIVGAAAVCAMAPAAAFGAPVDITAFSITPTCTHPGSTVTADVTVHNNGLLPVRIYAQTRTSYYGWLVQTSDVYGPYDVPPILSPSTSMQTTVPAYAPWGSYTVTLGIGPSPTDTTSYGTRSAGLGVAPQPFC